MITIVEGQGLGAGKSYLVVTMVIQYLVSGGTVFATGNFKLKWTEMKEYVRKTYGLELQDSQYRIIEAKDTFRIHEETAPGTPDNPVLIVLDEVQQQLNARDWADKSKRALFDWCCQSRHDDNDLIFISQSAHNIDKQVARFATHIYRVKNGKALSKFLLSVWPWFENYFVVNQYDQSGKNLLERKWTKKDPKIFGVYESKCMRGTHNRGVAAIAKLKLQKTKTKKMKLFPVLIILALCAVGYGAWSGNKTWNTLKTDKKADKTEAAKSTETAKPIVQLPPPQQSDCCGAYDIVTEQLRGTDYQSYLRTDKATYIAGQMSPRGMVQSIEGLTVRLNSPKGRTLFIVAQDAAIQSREPLPTPDLQKPVAVPPQPAVATTTQQAPFLDPSYEVSNPVQLLEKAASSPAITVSSDSSLPRERVMPFGITGAKSPSQPPKIQPKKSSVTVRDSSGKVTSL